MPPLPLLVKGNRGGCPSCPPSSGIPGYTLRVTSETLYSPEYVTSKHTHTKIIIAIDEDDSPQPFFDTEELFQQLNHECIDGATDAEADEDKVNIFTLENHCVSQD